VANKNKLRASRGDYARLEVSTTDTCACFYVIFDTAV